MFRYVIYGFLLALWSYIGADTSVYFSPQDHLAQYLIDRINHERASISIAVCSFTDERIAQALIEAKKRGVFIEMIIDPSTARRRAIGLLKKEGVSIFVWRPPSSIFSRGKRRATPIMDHRFCIFGEKSVWTGSFNFIDGIATHCDNAIVIEEPDITELYQKHFHSLKQQGSMPLATFLSERPSQVKKKTLQK